MKKITGMWLLTLSIVLMVLAGGLAQLYLKDNLVVSLGEAHEHSPDEEGAAGESAAVENTATSLVNLVANYSFEVGTDLAIDGWAPVGEDPGTSLWRDSSVQAYGSSSAALASVSGSRGVDLLWSQAIPSFTPGKNIKIKGFVKTEDLTGSAFLRVVGFQQTSQSTSLVVWLNLDTASGTSDWTAIEGAVYLPEEVNTLQVSVGLFGNGRAWFDEISILSAEPAGESLERNTNLLHSPDFSQGLTGWNFFSVPGTPLLDWGVREGGGAHGPSLFITQPQQTEEGYYSGFYQVVNDLKQTRDNAALTGWVKTSGLDGAARFDLTFYCFETKYVYESTVALSGTQDWQPLDVSVDVPANADSVWVRLVITGRGTAFFDDLDFRLVPPGS